MTINVNRVQIRVLDLAHLALSQGLVQALQVLNLAQAHGLVQAQAANIVNRLTIIKGATAPFIIGVTFHKLKTYRSIHHVNSCKAC